MSLPTILVAISDFFFVAKVEGTLQQLGYTVVRENDLETLLAAVAREQPSCLIVDLNSSRHEPMVLIERLKKDDKSNLLPILAYTNHSDLGAIRQALALGADKVVARSELSSYLPQLVDGLIDANR